MFQIELIKDELPQDPVIHSRTAVRGVILTEDGILMVETNRGDYKFPGGGVEAGETLQEALLREIAEETGYADVEVGPCIGTVFEQNEDTIEPGSYFQMKSIYYLCRLHSARRVPGVQDDYEEKLGFCGVTVGIAEAYDKNSALLGGFADGVKLLEEIPWLEREVRVLAVLKDSLILPFLLDVCDCGQIMLAADAERTAGAERGLGVDAKEGHANFVTKYDKRVQQELAERLKKRMPQAVFVGEEEDVHAGIAEGYAFIVDPIDGTTNFIRDYRCSCISVGLTYCGERIAGVVYNPYLEEMFWAEKGKGAFRNGEPIRVSEEPLENGIVLFGTAPYYEDLAKKSFEMAYDYFKRALDVRRSGSAAIDLCNVACGRAELYFELRLSPWDFAAGSLIVEEAGGRVTTVEGGALSLDAPCSVLAVNR